MSLSKWPYKRGAAASVSSRREKQNIGARLAQYEGLKAAWMDAHPGATVEQYEIAMRRLAKVSRV